MTMTKLFSPIKGMWGIFFLLPFIVACSDDEGPAKIISWDIGSPTTSEYSEDFYAGGLLGTTTVNTATAYQQPTKALENAGMMTAFNEGEYLFEKDYNTNTEGAFSGLGPVYVRRGCLYCHPGYGHGARQTEYKADNHRNGYLLVIYDKTTNAYIRSVAGMPQTGAVKPFKAPIDENQIKIAWQNYTDEWDNKFPDGETYSLIYPDVSIPYTAYYAPVVVQRSGTDTELSETEYDNDIGVLLESTIGIYGTGLTDAIPDEDITAQWKAESEYFKSIGRTDALNPSYGTALPTRGTASTAMPCKVTAQSMCDAIHTPFLVGLFSMLREQMPFGTLQTSHAPTADTIILTSRESIMP